MIRLPRPLYNLEQPWNVNGELLGNIWNSFDETIRGNWHLAGTILTEAEMLSGLDAVECYFEAMRVAELPNSAWIKSVYPPSPLDADGFPLSSRPIPIEHAAGWIDYQIGYLTEVSDELIEICLARYIPNYQWSAEFQHQTYLLWLHDQLRSNPDSIISTMLSVCARGQETPEVADRCLEILGSFWREAPERLHPDGSFNYKHETFTSLISLCHIAGSVSLPLLDQIVDETPIEFFREMAQMARRALRT